jgi:hypothetical protein
MVKKISLSVAIITKNEAENLPFCLSSVAFTDQIVIIDSGSTDKTKDIAQSFGCDFFLEDWKGFGRQKQSAIDKCKNEWVLVLDADERIPPETAEEIIKIVNRNDLEAAGYSFKRKNFFQGRWIRHMGWWPDPVTRLFRKSRGHMSQSLVHESLIINGPVKALQCCIDHHTESRLSRVLLKIDQYSTLGAQQAYAEGKRSSAWGAGLRATLTFLQSYFLRLGILDGAPGFTLSVTDAINKFFKYAKLSEIEKKER